MSPELIPQSDMQEEITDRGKLKELQAAWQITPDDREGNGIEHHYRGPDLQGHGIGYGFGARLA